MPTNLSVTSITTSTSTNSFHPTRWLISLVTSTKSKESKRVWWTKKSVFVIIWLNFEKTVVPTHWQRAVSCNTHIAKGSLIRTVMVGSASPVKASLWTLYSYRDWTKKRSRHSGCRRRDPKARRTLGRCETRKCSLSKHWSATEWWVYRTISLGKNCLWEIRLLLIPPRMEA